MSEQYRNVVKFYKKKREELIEKELACTADQEKYCSALFTHANFSCVKFESRGNE